VRDINHNDLLLMSHFRSNARKNLTIISRETAIPVSTIFAKLKRFEDSVIRRHTAIINFSKLGYGTIAKIMLKVDKMNRPKLKAYLDKHQNINSLSKINNGYDFIAECVFKNMNELENFLDDLDDICKIQKKSVYYVVDDIKREGFMLDSYLVPLTN